MAQFQMNSEWLIYDKNMIKDLIQLNYQVTNGASLSICLHVAEHYLHSTMQQSTVDV